jgi:hypothetical protein
MKLKENVNETTITETNSDFNEKECYDIITRKRLWTRNCPECDKIQFYSSKKTRNRASHRGKGLCAHCGLMNRQGWKWSPPKNYEDVKRRISEKLKGRSVPQERRDRIRISLTGKKASIKTREKLSRMRSGKNHHMFGKHHSEETKRKLRESILDRISKQKCNGEQVYPFFNRKSCEYFDKLNEQNNYKIRHALNGGEFRFRGYFADGYDEPTNTWYEWDEKHHYNIDGTLRQHDINRQIEITKYLGCKFVRIKE